MSKEVDDDEESVVAMDLDDDGKQKSKISFLEAEECCIKLAEYIKTSGAPQKNLEDVHCIARNLRSHHGSKPRMSILNLNILDRAGWRPVDRRRK